MPDFITPEITAVLGLVDTYLQWENANQPPRGHERYHPSAFGKCLRMMQYQRYEERGLIKGEPGGIDTHILRTFGNGHAMHDRWRTYFEGLGILRGYWRCQNPLCAATDNNGTIDPKISIADLMADPGHWLKLRRTYGTEELQGCFRPEQCICGWKKFHYMEIDVVDKDLNFAGHCDIILDFSHFDPAKWQGEKKLYNPDDLPKSNVVVDMKSINHFDFQNVAKGNPHDYYQVQLMIYANVLKCDYGILLYENKNNMRTAAFKVPRSEDYLWPQIVKQANLMNDVVDSTDEYGEPLCLLPPPRPFDKDSKDCDWCAYKQICHSSPIWDNADLYEIRKDFYGDLL